MIVYGSRLFGKVDAVGSLFHVATRFAHVWYIPLFPLGSWIVTEESGNGWRGFQIPLNLKSVFVAWLRGALVVAALVCGFMAMTATERSQSPVPMTILAAAAVASMVATYRVRAISVASAPRAEMYLRHIGVRPATEQTPTPAPLAQAG